MFVSQDCWGLLFNAGALCVAGTAKQLHDLLSYTYVPNFRHILLLKYIMHNPDILLTVSRHIQVNV